MNWAKKVLCDNQWTGMGGFPQESKNDLETCFISGGVAFGPNDLGMSSRGKEMGCFVQPVLEELELLRAITQNQIGRETQV